MLSTSRKISSLENPTHRPTLVRQTPEVGSMPGSHRVPSVTSPHHKARTVSVRHLRQLAMIMTLASGKCGKTVNIAVHIRLHFADGAHHAGAFPALRARQPACLIHPTPREFRNEGPRDPFANMSPPSTHATRRRHPTCRLNRRTEAVELRSNPGLRAQSRAFSRISRSRWSSRPSWKE